MNPFIDLFSKRVFVDEAVDKQGGEESLYPSRILSTNGDAWNPTPRLRSSIFVPEIDSGNREFLRIE
jgi:hypothetical protein